MGAVKPAVIGLVTTAVVTTFVYMVKCYGFKGTLKKLWDGDHLSVENREALDFLEQYNEVFDRILESIDEIELWLETQKLNSVDGSDRQSYSFRMSPKIRKNTAMLSHELDALAGKVDAIITRGLNDGIIAKKKAFSTNIVTTMSHLDHIINVLQAADDNFMMDTLEASSWLKV